MICDNCGKYSDVVRFNNKLLCPDCIGKYKSVLSNGIRDHALTVAVVVTAADYIDYENLSQELGFEESDTRAIYARPADKLYAEVKRFGQRAGSTR